MVGVAYIITDLRNTSIQEQIEFLDDCKEIEIVETRHRSVYAISHQVADVIKFSCDRLRSEYPNAKHYVVVPTHAGYMRMAFIMLATAMETDCGFAVCNPRIIVEPEELKDARKALLAIALTHDKLERGTKILHGLKYTNVYRRRDYRTISALLAYYYYEIVGGTSGGEEN